MTNGCHFNKNNIIVFADLIDFKLNRSEARMKKDLNRMKKKYYKTENGAAILLSAIFIIVVAIGFSPICICVICRPWAAIIRYFIRSILAMLPPDDECATNLNRYCLPQLELRFRIYRKQCNRHAITVHIGNMVNGRCARVRGPAHALTNHGVQRFSAFDCDSMCISGKSYMEARN